MSEKKIYTIEGFEGEFEFSPHGSPLVGTLKATHKEETFASKVDLEKLGSRAHWAKEAQGLYPKAFNAQELKRLLNELLIMRTEEVEVASQKAAEEGTEGPAEDDPELEEVAEGLVSEPGVLDRYVEEMAEIHEVHRDRAQMKVVMLGGISAQLDMLPTNKPLGTNVILAAEAGRGKNYVTDAIADGFPDEWVYRFESASAKSFYYETEQHPGRFEHVWVYPNEAEATDQLVEILRPLLSGGKAEHKTVNSDAAGSNVFREYKVKGPITATIPTVRNKLDTQLQTRMLVTDLEDFEGRVAQHSLKVSDTLLAGYAAKDHGKRLRTWKVAWHKLTGVRRVVLPRRDERFKFSSNEVSHGARLWRNFLSLVLTNAWLEQRNREMIDLPNGEPAIVATAADYRVVYEIFAAACKRSVVNLSKTHRNILDAVYDLQDENDLDDTNTGYSYRKIGEQAGLSHQTVKNHKSYLTQSVGLLREVEGGGLRLVKDAEPSWWAEGEVLDGFPRPEAVAEWWTDDDPEDPDDGGRGVSSASETALHHLQGENIHDNPDNYQENSVNPDSLQTGLRVNLGDSEDQQESEEGLHVKPMSTSEVDSEAGLDKPKAVRTGGVSSVSTDFENGKHPPTPVEPEFCKHNASVGAPCVFCGEEKEVREYLADPPARFLNMAEIILKKYSDHPEMPEQMVNNLATEVALDIFSDAHRGKRARPLVRAKLEEMRP